jgi:hydantoinase/carbamoylase family amidase
MLRPLTICLALVSFYERCAGLYALRERLEERLTELGKIGRLEGGGVSRPALGEAEIAARRYVGQLMMDAGLSVAVDDAGNMIGTRKGRLESPYVTTGSHIDTVLNGGIFDGALGVVGAIEAVKMMQDEGTVTELPLAVINFADEEGAYNSLGGSKFFAGSLSARDLYQSKSRHDGSIYGDKVGAALAGDRIARFTEPIKAHLELHIEQGPIMEKEGKDIGIVTGIVAMNWVGISLTGVQSHAGTTPMSLRHDPVLVGARIVSEVREIVKSYGEMVGTVGSFKVSPNVSNVIARQVDLNVDVRSLSMPDLTAAIDRIQKRAKELADQEGVGFRSDIASIAESTPCAKEVVDAITEATERLGYSCMYMPSRAGHDTESMARVAKVGMVFVPSRGGVSHAPEEFTDFEQAHRGVEVLKRSMLSLASGS